MFVAYHLVFLFISFGVSTPEVKNPIVNKSFNVTDFPIELVVPYDTFGSGSSSEKVTLGVISSLPSWLSSSKFDFSTLTTLTFDSVAPIQMKKVGGNLYIVTSNSSFRIFDVDDPKNVVELGSYTFSTKTIVEIEISEDYLYCLTNEPSHQYSTFWIFSLIDKSNPVIVGFHPSYDDDCNGIAVDENSKTLYIGCNCALEIFDISLKSNPFYVESLTPPRVYDINDLVIRDNKLHLAEEGIYHIFQLGEDYNNYQSLYEGSYHLFSRVYVDEIHSIDLSYLLDSAYNDKKILFVNFSEPLHYFAEYDVAINPVSLDIGKERMYIADRDYGIRVIDLNDRTSVSEFLLSDMKSSGNINEVIVDGNSVFLISNIGLEVLQMDVIHIEGNEFPTSECSHRGLNEEVMTASVTIEATDEVSGESVETTFQISVDCSSIDRVRGEESSEKKSNDDSATTIIIGSVLGAVGGLTAIPLFVLYCISPFVLFILIPSLIILFCLPSLIFPFCCCCGIASFFLRKERKRKSSEAKFLKRESDVERKHSNFAKLEINKSLFVIKLNEIKLLSVLGKGGSDSTVFKASFNGVVVAYKQFKTSDICHSQDVFDEFEKEGSLSHPNTLRFYGAILEPPRVGIVMEFCENGDLTHFILYHKEIQANYPLQEKIRLLREIAIAMNFLHSRNIIHRDLKTDNVLIDGEEHCKVMDFGCSKLVDQIMSTSQKTARLGTPEFMAPEVVLGGGHYDSKIDVFSYGVIVFCTISENFHPYGSFNHCIELQVANDENFRPKVSEMEKYLVNEDEKWVIDIAKTSWRKEPDQRYDFGRICELFLENSKGKD